MQCFSFIKAMMVLFNFLIFVSMETVGSLGLSKGVGHNLRRAQVGHRRLLYSVSVLPVSPDDRVQMSPQMLSPGPSAAAQAGVEKLKGIPFLPDLE